MVNHFSGKFITFEGIDGCGKSTQIELLAQTLTSKGILVLKTKEPGGTQLGVVLRKMLLDDPMVLNSYAELLLFLADRIEHIHKVIVPALQKGIWVLSDRYWDSTLAYQGYGRKLDLKWIQDLANSEPLCLKPDLTFLMDISVEESIKRRLSKKADKMETESKKFLEDVRSGFLQLAQKEKERILLVDGSKDIEMIQSEIEEKSFILTS